MVDFNSNIDSYTISIKWCTHSSREWLSIFLHVVFGGIFVVCLVRIEEKLVREVVVFAFDSKLLLLLYKYFARFCYFRLLWLKSEISGSLEYYVARKLTKCKIMIMARHVIAFYVNEEENLSYVLKYFVTHRDNRQKSCVFLPRYGCKLFSQQLLTLSITVTLCSGCHNWRWVHRKARSFNRRYKHIK